MILVTGASGFIGKELVRELLKDSNLELKLLSRYSRSDSSRTTNYVKELGPSENYADVLDSVDTVVHCAAMVQAMSSESGSSMEQFKAVNTDGTLNLAQQAANAGVRRFVFLSSIKVNGECTDVGYPLTNVSPPAPSDAYSRSKLEAEKGLVKISNESRMEVVIIRPPLVYGAGARGNFSSLAKMVSKRIPLPFGLLKDNKRSLVSVQNLVSLITVCIKHPKASGETFLVSDGRPVSTNELVNSISSSIGKSVLQIPVPVTFFRLIGRVLGKPDVVERLVGSLEVDITHTKEVLNWNPPQTMQEALNLSVKEYRK